MTTGSRVKFRAKKVQKVNQCSNGCRTDSHSKERVMGILEGCPMKQCKCDCPLKGIADYSLQERMEWINSLDREMIYEVLTCYRSCVIKRHKMRSFSPVEG
jgi:hypothetical protein